MTRHEGYIRTAMVLFPGNCISQVRNKAWFGMLEAFSTFLSSWTIIAESIKYSAHILAGQAGPGWDEEELSYVGVVILSLKIEKNVLYLFSAQILILVRNGILTENQKKQCFIFGHWEYCARPLIGVLFSWNSVMGLPTTVHNHRLPFRMDIQIKVKRCFFPAVFSTNVSTTGFSLHNPFTKKTKTFTSLNFSFLVIDSGACVTFKRGVKFVTCLYESIETTSK